MIPGEETGKNGKHCNDKGSPAIKKTVKKVTMSLYGGGEVGHPQYLFLAQIYQDLKSLGN